ncbi:MAG TPA: phosphoenolpyruvate carboxykinase (GTP) [Candidatus Limnocylindria bacterium]|jgi:phosphoenolpyruvate carboxykinase (GTP)|nr:phosphoenolpyruvate carboxykinase (GTP) [Candidatus Limnocylindria bacterium]
MLVAKEAPTSNAHLLSWVEDMARMCKPDRVYWCDGSEEEAKTLTAEAVSEGVLIPLDAEKRPRSFYSRSNPNDVARTEELTFVCTPTKAEAGNTNNWMPPEETYEKLAAIYDGAMKGRTMYVIPYLMGSPESPFAMLGVELTDSIYVALNMRIMARIGKIALDRLGDSSDFNRGVHSVADCDPARRYVCHFPQDNTIWSVGSGYGGNALLGKKCLALRIASYRAKQEGWLAEHMMLLEAESPEGETHFIAGAFPSASGKTNLAMLVPPQALQGWKIRTIGDDIAWMRVGDDGRLYAVNPEAGFFGVAPGTNYHTNPVAMRMLEHDCIFTNVALTPDLDVWWEGMDGPSTDLIDWRGRPWKRGSKEPAAHPNSRFTAPMDNNGSLSRYAKDPRGVPISAILFGGRRSTTVPLVVESFNWTHGVYLGATAGAETTAAITGAVGRIRRDPMAMLAFIGYDAGAYFEHWLSMFGRMSHPPKIFLVNWFRKGDDGRYLWPGYGENMRVLKWIIDRCVGQAAALETPVGYTPRVADLDLRGLDASAEAIATALRVDPAEWAKELEAHGDWFEKLGGTVPEALRLQRRLLLASLKAVS